MRDSKNLPIESFEEITDRLENTKNKCEIELLKHYAINYILYLSSEKKEDSPMKEKLLKIGILLDRCRTMKKKEVKNPRKKFKENSEKLKERTKPKEDFNIS